MSMFTEIINPFINVRNKIKNRSGQWVDETKEIGETKMHTRWNVDLDDNEELVVFENWGKKIIVESIFISSDAEVSPHLFISDSGNDAQTNIFRSIQSPQAMGFATPNRINNADRHHDYIDLVEYDGINDGVPSRAMMLLKKPITLYSGGKLVLQANQTTPDSRLTFKVVWHEIEV